MILKDSTWVEVKNALKTTKLAIIPLGAIESHGPHNPVGIECFVVEELARRLDDRVDSIILPTIPVSMSKMWSEFAGTLWVASTTFKAYIGEICNSLIEHGITHIFFLNGHGPNISPIADIMQTLASQDVRCAQIDLWRFVEGLSKDLGTSQLPMAHSGELPTSIMLALREDLVRRDELRKERPQETLNDAFPDILQYYSSTLTTPSAFAGNPAKATREKGELILLRCVERLELFLQQWIAQTTNIRLEGTTCQE